MCAFVRGDQYCGVFRTSLHLKSRERKELDNEQHLMWKNISEMQGDITFCSSRRVHQDVQ